VTQDSTARPTKATPASPSRAAFRFRFCLFVFAAAWLLRLGAAIVTDRVHEFSRMDMERVALSLVNHGVLGNPFHEPTGPSAIVPPGYVLFLAAIFQLLGTGVMAEAVKIATCTAAAALRCALTPWLADHFNLGKPVVIASGILSIFWIGAVDTELQGDWDAPYTAVLLIVLICLHFRKPLLDSTPKRAALLGLFWGAAALINPAVLSILVTLVALEFWRGGRARFGPFARRVACVGACAVLVLAPWAIRNRLSLGSWIWLRDGLGLEMKLSYHDGSSWANIYNIRPSLEYPDRPNRDAEISHHPYISTAENRRVQQIGEVAYFAQMKQEAVDWIRAHPSQSLTLIAQHTFYYWFPPGPSFYGFRPGKGIILYSFARWALTLLAFAGLAICWKRHRDAALYFTAILLVFPLVYYLVNWSSRYRSPIEWLLVLLAAIPLAWVWQRIAPSQS
jgi:hypothetical protein